MQYIRGYNDVAYTCDRCKEVLDYHPTPFVLNIDLCEDCIDSFKKWFKEPFNDVTVDGKSYYVVTRDNKLVLERPYREPVAFDTKQELMEYLKNEKVDKH